MWLIIVEAPMGYREAIINKVSPKLLTILHLVRHFTDALCSDHKCLFISSIPAFWYSSIHINACSRNFKQQLRVADFWSLILVASPFRPWTSILHFHNFQSCGAVFLCFEPRGRSLKFGSRPCNFFECLVYFCDHFNCLAAAIESATFVAFVICEFFLHIH